MAAKKASSDERKAKPGGKSVRPPRAKKAATPAKFKGYEAARYQVHDAKIVDLVDAFNLDKAWIGATSGQVADIDDISYDLVKAWIIQESGGGDAASLAAWSVDPAQVNVPGDWNDYKLSLGLKKPSQINTGDIRTNLKAAIGYLARKGFGKSGQPPSNNPQTHFDGWPIALQRYNGRSDGTPPYRERYAKRIVDRANNPNTHFPIELATILEASIGNVRLETTMSFEYIMDTISGRKAVGRLVWGDKEYAAISGPYGAGYIEAGDYTVKVREVATGPDMEPAYCLVDSGGTKVCYFIPLKPNFTTGRTGIGIHPDGNVSGTEGCIGLQEPDFEKFWTRWNATPMNDRPTLLKVKKAGAFLDIDYAVAETSIALNSNFEQRMKDVSQFLADGQRIEKFFPHGITKVSLTIKIGGADISFEVSGPEKS